MLASVKDSPSKLTWVLLGVEKRSSFGTEKSDDFTVSFTVSHTVARVDFQAAEVT